jgi:flagellar biosynthetic protein FliR
MNGLSLVQALQPAHWPTLVLVSARIVGLMLAAPLWSMAGVPKSFRGAIVIVFTLVILPSVEPGRLPPDYLGVVLPLASELMFGLAIGLIGAVFMAGIGMAGEVAALQMGLNLGPALSPMADASVTGVGELMNLLALCLYVTLGGHLVLLTGVAESFRSVPPGVAVDLTEGGRAVASLAGTVFSVAIRASAPIMAALLLANFGLAILSRAVPQLNAMAVAFPITIGLGFLMFGAALPFTGAFIGQWASGIDGSVARMVGAFAPAAGR